MGTMSFLLPADVPADATKDLQRATLAGGFDNAPAPTRVRLEGRRLTLQRTVDESGFLAIPWRVEGVGQVMVTTATLIERAEPYSLAVELARGKVNQVRAYVADWEQLGVDLPVELEAGLVAVSRSFGQVVARHPSAEADRGALAVLAEAFRLSDRLVRHYTDRQFRLRHQRVARLDAALGCQIASIPTVADLAAETFNTVRLGLNWRVIEPSESKYDWTAADTVLEWAESKSMTVVSGPLIDFTATGVPDWLWIWQGDLSILANFMCDYVGIVVSRYRGRIRRWHLATGCNVGGTLGLAEDDLLWLTARLAEAALQVAPEVELVVGVAQPWGDYMAHDEYTYTPLVFLDTLLRTGLKLAALDIEVVLGVSPQGSYWRDLLDVARLLDGYAVLSTPVQVTLGVPATSGPDAAADASLKVGLGAWDGGYDAAVQADRGAAIAALSLSKPYVNGVYWTQFSDAEPHRFPHCGLLDSGGRPRPILDELRRLRQAHLR